MVGERQFKYVVFENSGPVVQRDHSLLAEKATNCNYPPKEVGEQTFRVKLRLLSRRR